MLGRRYAQAQPQGDASADAAQLMLGQLAGCCGVAELKS